MSDVDLAKLRVPFPPDYVGKLPRVTCGKCSRGNCDEGHKKARCDVCKSYISERHIHLDYVGHADVTIRLLEVDPEWSWAPKATEPDPEMLKAAVASGDAEIVRMVIENAPPKFETDSGGHPVGLWIKLTVGGVTRLGVGSCPSGQNDAEKVLIGDALRNAAMRFGVAVDLWAKGDRADPSAENATASAGTAQRSRPAQRQEPAQGRVSRPETQQEAPPAGEPADPDAQALADEASQCRALTDLTTVHGKAQEQHKLQAWVADPGTGVKGKLIAYLNFRKKALGEVDAALADLDAASRAARMDAGDLDIHVKRVTGVTVDEASAVQLRQAAEALREKVPA